MKASRSAALLCLVGWVGAAAALAAAAPPAPPAPPVPALPGYAEELASLEEQLAAAAPATPTLEALARHAYLVYRKASLTADYRDFRAAEQAIDAALAVAGPAEDLYFLKASFDFKLHRLERARASLSKTPDLEGEPRLLALRADLAYQEGRYLEARAGYQAALRQKRSWDNLARLAFYLSRTGDPRTADALYREAQDDLSAKEMRSWAWIELQRGLLELDRGRPARALAHYRRADRAYPGWWQVEEHLAEALARLGRRQEAIALYRQVIAQRPDPEFLGALAALLEPEDPGAAEQLDRAARARFAEQCALYPEAASGHFLEQRLARGAADAELLDLARRNFALRPNGEARLLLARALLAAGEAAAAEAEIATILASPFRVPALKEVRREVHKALRGRSRPPG